MRSLALLLALEAVALAGGFLDGKVVDLSYAFDANTIYWPTEETFVLTVEHAEKTSKGYYYAANKFRAPEHGGTHMDAPIHFAEGHATVEKVGLEQLMGEAVLIDVRDSCAKNPDYRISIDDFAAWEKLNGAIPQHAIVLLRTGFGRYWPDRNKYLGTDERGVAAVAKLHFPGLHADAARWLVEKRAIHAVGLDTASIDPGQSTTFDAHRILFAADVPAFENLANLDRLPAKGMTVIALPMKIAGGSGAPLRAIAVVR
jgi:kynurenine formamidase